MESLLVPSSMQRIRSFLVEMCGMKVKPWASTEETLAALHTTLLAKHGCGIFWDSLRTLLQKLASDLKARASAEPGTLIDNEVLEDERYTRLLDEIRQILARQENPSSFRQLSAALSAPALGLLLFLGGVASVGCEHSGLKPMPGKSDAALAADASSYPVKCCPPRPDDGGQVNPFVDAPPATPPDTQPAAPADGPTIRIIIPDAAPRPDAATRNADGGVVTIQDIMDSCNLPKDDQDRVLACLRRLRDSWTTGIAETLAGTSCANVIDDLQCFGSVSQTCHSGSNAEFVVGTTRVCQPILIYAGVRFV